MVDQSAKKPKCFVIMPFGERFDEIYDGFLREKIGAAGFNVLRADDITSVQNILKDIVISIAESDLIVADLTESNPNVFYELGLAHALRKPVILLTQDLIDLPFDLRSYRVIHYSTHFKDMERAGRGLDQLLAEAVGGTAKFGSPVIDFLPEHLAETIRVPVELPQEGEPGFLDYLSDAENGLEELTAVIDEVNTQTDQLTKKTNSVTKQINELSNKPEHFTARRARAVINQLTQTYDTYTTSLSSVNDRYTTELERTRIGLESVVGLQSPKSNEERIELTKYLDQLTGLEDTSRDALTGIDSMVVALRETPNIERANNRAKNRMLTELDRLTGNIEQTISMFARVRVIGESKLQDSEDEAN